MYEQGQFSPNKRVPFFPADPLNNSGECVSAKIPLTDTVFLALKSGVSTVIEKKNYVIHSLTTRAAQNIY